MALEVVVLDKDEYNALIDNQADKDELEYLKACQYALESFNKVRGLCPKCKKIRYNRWMGLSLLWV